MPYFRKKPVVIEAVQFDGTNDYAIAQWIGRACNVAHDAAVFIQTAEGEMRTDVGDWIIKGIKGEFYPCKPDIFAATYEPTDPIPGGSHD